MDNIAVGLEGDCLRALAVGMIEEIPLDGEERAIGSEFIIFSIAPNADDFSSVADVEGDVFEARIGNGIVTTSFDSIADEGMHIALSVEIAAVHKVVVSAKKNPVIIRLKIRRVVVQDGRVLKHAVVGAEFHD